MPIPGMGPARAAQGLDAIRSGLRLRHGSALRLAHAPELSFPMRKSSALNEDVRHEIARTNCFHQQLENACHKLQPYKPCSETKRHTR